MTRVRTPLFAMALTLGVLFSSTGVASAHANKFLWNDYGDRCRTTSQSGTGWIKEQGTTGTTWMRITAYFQYFRNGHWYTQKSSYTQNSSQFRNNHGDHTLYRTFTFSYRGPTARNTTRIRYWFQWYNRNTLIKSAYRSSNYCYA